MTSRRARSRARLDERLARSFTQPITRRIRAEASAVLKTGSEAGARAAVSTPAWKATLGSLWLSDPVLEIVQDQSADLGGPSEVSRETRKLFTQIAHGHAKEIADTQRDLISTALANAEKEFRSTERRALRELYESQIEERGGRLAFQEALQATETARYEGARQTPVAEEDQLLKVWFTLGDSKVRPTHQAANGQSRVVTQKRGGAPGMFRVGGALLEHPRDPNGPPEEIVNCRCFLEYRRRKRRRRGTR